MGVLAHALPSGMAETAMLREDPPHSPPLMPYASHVAQGTARTPIGIILFATSHLLLGGVLLLAAFVLLRWVLLRPTVPDWIVFAAVMFLALPMLTGGVALLLKGPLAHAAALASFTLLSVLEAATIAYAAGITVRYVRHRNPDQVWAIVFLALAVGLAYLCRIVVGYLAGAKARATFALPPGDSSRPMRLLPTLVMLLYVVALLAGPLLSRVRPLFPD
jgi:hypothetical protein